jgi:hypothetical protein
MNFADAGHAAHAEREDNIVTDIGTRGTAYSRSTKSRIPRVGNHGYCSTVLVRPTGLGGANVR